MNYELQDVQAGFRKGVKQKSEKAGLKLNIQKTNIMASAAIIHGK